VNIQTRRTTAFVRKLIKFELSMLATAKNKLEKRTQIPTSMIEKIIN
jgi:hypothetical protein